MVVVGGVMEGGRDLVLFNALPPTHNSSKGGGYVGGVGTTRGQVTAKVD